MSSNEAPLWDDSALLNAFNNAMSKYKAMHGKEQFDLNVDSKEEEKIVSVGDENASTEVTVEAVVSSPEVGEVNDLPLVQDNPQTDLHAPESDTEASTGTHKQEVLEPGYTTSQGADEYNQLLNQYYELEEQRQKVLQQLHQAAYENYGLDPSGQFGTCSTHEHQTSNYQMSQSYACCPYACYGLAVPCSVMPACSLGKTSANEICSVTPNACTMGAGKISSVEDDGIAKTVMGAAEKAISSMKSNASSASDVHIGSSEVDRLAGSTSAETDLNAVLNAWYSAGFLTGKYISEQSAAKKQQE